MIHGNTVSMSGTLKTALKKTTTKKNTKQKKHKKKTDTPLGEDNH